MINRLQNFFANTQAVQTPVVNKPIGTLSSGNPFANPFLNKDIANMHAEQKNYAKNEPVPGGYFAGYYNDKPNIVGSRLFVEV